MGVVDYVRKLFDLLYASTSDETEHYGTYANARSDEGTYSITNTQYGDGVYAARRSEDGAEAGGTGRSGGGDECDRTDPETGSECQPNPDN